MRIAKIICAIFGIVSSSRLDQIHSQTNSRTNPRPTNRIVERKKRRYHQRRLLNDNFDNVENKFEDLKFFFGRL